MKPNRRSFCSWLAVVAVLTAVTLAGRAAPASEPVVALPPMVIEESTSLPPWLYVQDGGTEYLSRCKESITREYVEMRRVRMYWVRALVPSELLARYDTPGVTILVSQKLKPGNNAEVVGDVLKTNVGRSREGFREARYAPNMMLHDVDNIGVFAYIDETSFDGDNLTISTDQLRFLIAARTPRPPEWLVNALVDAYGSVRFGDDPVTLRSQSWHSREEMQALEKNTAAARTLLPIAELLGDFDAPGPRALIARVQRELLVRWALDSRNGAREGFRKFALAACEVPSGEAALRANLGLGYSDLRDRLSDYLPQALREELVVPLGPVPAKTRIEIRPATPLEIARLRGEWERLTLPLVRQRHPDHAARYVEQARRTLHRAYDVGERDPRLLASMALCEIDAGNPAVARELLEAAVADPAARPRAGFELARLRWLDLVRGQPPARQFSPADLRPVLEPLRAALDRAPAIAPAVQLWAEAWTRCTAAPDESDAKRLKWGARQFVSVPRVVIGAAGALGRHGRRDEAMELLGAGFLFASDDATRVQFAQLAGALQPRPAK